MNLLSIDERERNGPQPAPPSAAGMQDVLLDPVARATMSQYRRNVENFIGLARVPIGLAGPLLVHGEHARGEFHIPLATTEAALVASYTRGARLITEAGGCQAALLDSGVTRSPGFVFGSLREACAFVRWVCTIRGELEAIASTTTRHGRLTALEAQVEGNHVYLDMRFQTGDAAGQNMVTFAAEALCRHLVAHAPSPPRRHFIEANHSGDKKACARSLDSVRGRRACAEAVLPAALVRKRLHVEPLLLCDYWRMGAIGGVLAGAIGIQGHYANGLAALYLACGQDVACVAESAVGITRLELQDDGSLYAAVTLPNLIVGTVGGGTGLPTQRACLELLGLGGAGHANALAEVCAALALAGELSIMGAICAHEFASAHRKLARGRSLPTFGSER